MLCSKALVHTLLALLDAKQAAPITRAACAAYLASFLARGKFVPLEVVVGTLHSMADWAIR